MDDLEVYEITSPLPFEPTTCDYVQTERDENKKYKEYPGGQSMDVFEKKAGNGAR